MNVGYVHASYLTIWINEMGWWLDGQFFPQNVLELKNIVQFCRRVCSIAACLAAHQILILKYYLISDIILSNIETTPVVLFCIWLYPRGFGSGHKKHG